MSGRLYIFCKAFLLMGNFFKPFVLMQLLGVLMKINSSIQVNSFSKKADSLSNSAKSILQTNSENNISSKISASVYKANFLPAFGKYKKIKNIQLFDKKTQKPVKASLVKDTNHNFYMYKIMVGRKEAGFMHLIPNSDFPAVNYLLDESNNDIPEVLHLRSILGDKYSGIGTQLLKAGIEESEKIGKNGALWLVAQKGYAASFSEYRRDENPIPFYYKVGFKAINDKINNEIKALIKNGDYKSLPTSAALVLSSQDIYNFKKYYASRFTYKDKTD